MVRFVENLETELSESTGLNNLGIARAHRALGPKPAETATPRSTVVRFLKYTSKEEMWRVAWRNSITVDGNRVFFDHDYATGVMDKRKEYLPIKKVVKEEGVRFHTPMTKMRVFLDSETVTYESTDQAAEDLQAKGFRIPPTLEGRPRGAMQLSSGWERAKKNNSTETESSTRDLNMILNPELKDGLKEGFRT
ncbi:hypothetical protein JOQ06_010868 [Pogonophryne albipinna]|uniref:Uncharacterized protein n=1 Tax=Pogonophryne albipinna TaxID=1090488 RepID=A0AAD6AV03_9TELE|nr:hypothetical protein JOQ06_010868 [Pogonophryne albipinna]